MTKINIELTLSQCAMLLSAIDNRLRDIESVIAICHQRKYYVPNRSALDFERAELRGAQEVIKNAIPID